MIVAVSDNGASAEGGPKGSINDGRLMNGAPAGRRELRARIDEIGGPTAHNNYPWGWTMAGNTPFKRWKREVHEGGVADPCIVSVPGVSGGGTRRQFAHAIDVVPTILELDGRRDARRHRRRRAIAPRRRELRVGAARSRRRRDARDATLRDARLARDLPPRLEGRDVPSHGRDVRRRPRPRCSVRRRRVGAVRRGRRSVGDERPCRGRARAPGGDGRALVAGGGTQRRAAPRQPPAVRDPESAPDHAASRARRTCTTRTVRRCRSRWP